MSKEYNTPAMFQALYSNPEQVFERKADGLIVKADKSHVIIEGGTADISLNDVWILKKVDKKVTFREAVEAYIKGENVRCECRNGNFKYYYKHTGRFATEFVDIHGYGLLTEEIQDGDWYIEAE